MGLPPELQVLITRLLSLEDLIRFAKLTGDSRLWSACAVRGGVTDIVIAGRKDTQPLLLLNLDLAPTFRCLNRLIIESHPQFVHPTGWLLSLPRHMLEISIAGPHSFDFFQRYVDARDSAQFYSFGADRQVNP